MIYAFPYPMTLTFCTWAKSLVQSLSSFHKDAWMSFHNMYDTQQK